MAADPNSRPPLSWNGLSPPTALAELRGLAERKGFRPGWTVSAFAELFPGVTLPAKMLEPKMPSRAISRWVRNRGAQWARDRLEADMALGARAQEPINLNPALGWSEGRLCGSDFQL